MSIRLHSLHCMLFIILQFPFITELSLPEKQTPRDRRHTEITGEAVSDSDGGDGSYSSEDGSSDDDMDSPSQQSEDTLEQDTETSSDTDSEDEDDSTLSTTSPVTPSAPADVPPLCLRVGVQNLGTGGWRKSGLAAVALMKAYNISILALNETHMPFGASFDEYEDGRYTVLVPESRWGQGTHRGGVALLVDNECDSLADAQVDAVQEDSRHNCAWYCIRLRGRMLYLCALYLPPDDKRAVCDKLMCDDVECRGNHVEQTCHMVRAAAARFRDSGAEVMVVGDLNASPPLTSEYNTASGSAPSKGALKQWRRVKPALLDIIHPVDGEGSVGDTLDQDVSISFIPLVDHHGDMLLTRRDPTSQRCTTLDYVLTLPEMLRRGAVSHCYSTEHAVSDHLLLFTDMKFDEQDQLASRQEVASGEVHDDHRLIQASELPPDITRVYLKFDHTVDTDQEVAARWSLYDHMVESHAKDVGDEVPTLSQLTQLESLALRQAGLTAGGNRRQSKRLDTAQPSSEEQLLREYARSLPANDAAVLDRVYARLQDMQCARNVIRDAKRKIAKATERGFTAACRKQRKRLTRAEVVLTRLSKELRRVRLQRRALHRQGIASLRKAAVSSQQGVLLASLVSALNQTPTGARSKRSKKPRQFTATQLVEYAVELQRTYDPQDREVLQLDPVVAQRATTLRMQPEHHDAMNDPFLPAEVLAAIKHMRSSSAATGTPVRVQQRTREGSHRLAMLTRLLNGYLDSPETLPPEMALTVICPALKPGLPADKVTSYRKIGVCCSVSRILQTLISERLLLYCKRTGCMDEAQHGFLKGCTVDGAIWLSRVLSEPYLSSRTTKLVNLFVDLCTAFASTQHATVLTALEGIGVRGPMWSLVQHFLQAQSVTMSSGGIAVRPIHVRVGLSEGLAIAPVLWCVQLNPLLTTLRQHVVANPSSYPAAGYGRALAASSVVFADDLRVMSLTASEAQRGLDAIADFARRQGMTINCRPGKTELVVMGAGRQQPLQLGIGDDFLRQADEYKHLGVMVVATGGAESYSRQLERVTQNYQQAVARLTASGVRDAPPGHARLVLVTRLRPIVSFGVGVWAAGAPGTPLVHSGARLPSLDRHTMQAITRMDHAPQPVLECLVAVVSLETEYRVAAVRLLMRLLALPPTDHLFRTLQDTVARDDSARVAAGERTWWRSVVTVLTEMDQEDSDQPVVTGVATIGSPFDKRATGWLESVRRVVHRSGTAGEIDQLVQSMTDRWRSSVYHVDWAKRQRRMDALVSLTATRDLLWDPSAWDGPLPFLFQERTRANVYRAHLRAGTHYLLGHAHWNAPCPHCYSERVCVSVTVPHLLRDCTRWASERRDLQLALLQLGVQEGVMEPDTHVQPVEDPAHPPSQAEREAHLPAATLWYWLLVGAPVPTTFLRSTVFTERRSQKDGQRRSGDHRRDVGIYHRMLDMCAPLLERVLRETQQHFSVKRYSATEDISRRRQATQQ